MSSWAPGSGSFVSLAKGGNGQARTAWQLSGRPSESGSVCPAADLAPGSVSAVRCGLPHLSVSPWAGRGRGEVLRVRGKRGPSCRRAQGAGKTPPPHPRLTSFNFGFLLPEVRRPGSAGSCSWAGVHLISPHLGTPRPGQSLGAGPDFKTRPSNRIFQCLVRGGVLRTSPTSLR